MFVLHDVNRFLFAYVLLITSSYSLVYKNDNCTLRGKEGICLPLNKCESWFRQVLAAGSPVPDKIRRKLQEAACGFEESQPLVCCLREVSVSSDGFMSDQDASHSNNWEHGNDANGPWTNQIDNNGNINKPQSNDANYWNSVSNNNEEGDSGHSSHWPNQRPNQNDGSSNSWSNQGPNEHDSSSNSWSNQRPNEHDSSSNSWSNQRPNKQDSSSNSWSNQRPNEHHGSSNSWSNQRPDRNVDSSSSSSSSSNKYDNFGDTVSKEHLNQNVYSSNTDDSDQLSEVSRHRNLNLLPTNCGILEDNRIVGGNRTALYEMPWMVLLFYETPRGTKLSCGGTLVTRWYILTAAHCVTRLASNMELKGAILGEHDVRSDPDCERSEGVLHCAPSARNVSFDRVIPHPGYSPDTLFDDIALIKLSEPADFSLDSMKPICLPSSPELQNENLTGARGVVAGWGATEGGLQSPVLLSVELPIKSNAQCQSSYNGNLHIYNRQMCAGGLQAKDSCGGDSGGPLMYPGRIGGRTRYIQRGIVSFGSKRCGVDGYPGIYTRVAYYMNWILDNITD